MSNEPKSEMVYISKECQTKTVDFIETSLKLLEIDKTLIKNIPTSAYMQLCEDRDDLDKKLNLIFLDLEQSACFYPHALQKPGAD